MAQVVVDQKATCVILSNWVASWIAVLSKQQTSSRPSFLEVIALLLGIVLARQAHLLPINGDRHIVVVETSSKVMSSLSRLAKDPRELMTESKFPLVM